MNTTFTNYAEKKAKQILNLLQGCTKGIRLTAILILLLMGVSNAWGENGFYEVYMVYSSANSDHNYTFTSGQNNIGTYDLGTGTSPFVIKELYLKFWDDWHDKPTVGGQMCYKINDGATQYFGNNTWSQTSYSGNNSELQNSNCNHTVVSASGKYTFKIWWQMWGWGSDSWINNGGKNYTWTYTINPPAINNFTVTATGHISGSGTNNDPYIIPPGQSLTLNLSGSKAHTDANSSPQYNTSGTWNTNTSRTINNITSTTAQSVTVKMRCHNSSASLSGTESSKTIYYKAATYNLVGSMNSWSTSKNPMTIIEGDIAESRIHLIAGDYDFKIVDNGTWHTMKSTTKDIYRTSNTGDFSEIGGTNNNTWLHADATGDYIFRYNITNYTLTVIYPELQYYLVGDFGNGWDSEGVQFVDGKVTKTLTKRERPEYTFKVKASNGKHYTAVNKEMLQFTRQHTTEVISDNTDYNSEPYYNLSLQADMDGEYTFEFDPATFKLTVTHPEYSPKAAYLVGDFSDGQPGTDADDPGYDWTEEYGKQFTTNANQTEGTVEICDWAGQQSTWNFKIKINGIWYGLKETMSTSGHWILTSEYAYLSGRDCTLETNGEEGCYTFKYTTLPNENLDLLIIFPNDTRTVTFEMKGHGTQVPVQNVQYMQTVAEPQVADADEHLFAGWYTDEACTPGKEYDFDTPVTENITLYAKWIPYDDCIFFKNNLNWENVYVYFYSSDKYWNDWYGTGSQKDKELNGSSAHYRGFRGKMSKIGKTDIWYIDYIATAKKIDPTYWAEIKESKNVVFTQHEQYDKEWFWKTSVVRRGDFNKELSLYVPHRSKSYDKNDCAYHNHGLWMKYNSIESGYDWRGATSEAQDNPSWQDDGKSFRADNPGGYSFTTVVKFGNPDLHYFKIHNAKNDWFGNGGTMTQTNCTKWIFGTDNLSIPNAKITPTVYGDNFEYIFTLYLGNGEVEVSLEYPLSTGDLRLAYKDRQADSFHPGHHIKQLLSDGTRIDTVSFFVWDSEEPKIILQTCTGFSNGDPIWGDNVEYDVSSYVNADAVYNFVLKQTKNGTYSKEVDAAETHLYTGDYYIRTDAAAGGWKTFRQEGNKMTYSSYADEHEDFDHYFCEWVSQNKGLKNVSYTVANDYSYCISDTLHDDVDTNHPIIVSNNNLNEKGNLPVKNGTLRNANVRWGWDSKTNKIRRAYLSGSSNVYDRFLVVTGNEHLLDANGNALPAGTNGSPRYGLKANEDIFQDMGNWVYQVDVTASSQTLVNLTAKYNDQVQIFKGQDGTPNHPLLTSTSGSESYTIRLMYDFKTNHLIVAWLADGSAGDLGADMMIIRENQEAATQIDFTGKTLSNVKYAYAVMTFTKEFVNGSEPIHARKHYWVSFPFDVKINEIFGFSEYMDHWILQLYDGKQRAEKGWWNDDETFWKYITNKNYTLKKGVGYVLTLDLSKMKENSSVFQHTDEVSLYFPSAGEIENIQGQATTTVTVPAHECKITTANRTIYDSNWNIIGVPGFADIKNYETSSDHAPLRYSVDSLSFYYEYLPATNTYRTNMTEEAKTNDDQAGSHKRTFQAMYGYMVQYAGNLSWTTTLAKPSQQLAARRNSESDEPEKISFRLEIAQDDVMADQTFVQLQQEGATAEFDMNLDLTKIINSGANIYTLAGEQRIQSAGNALPMGEAIVPVGVQIATEGEYTFRMPDGTEGMVVELIDYERDITTNLLLFDYTVTLPAGSNESRFALHIQPQKDVTTGVGNVGDKVKGIEKYLIDGKLIIRTAEGAVYDAQGRRM